MLLLLHVVLTVGHKLGRESHLSGSHLLLISSMLGCRRRRHRISTMHESLVKVCKFAGTSGAS